MGFDRNGKHCLGLKPTPRSLRFPFASIALPSRPLRYFPRYAKASRFFLSNPQASNREVIGTSEMYEGKAAGKRGLSL